MLADAQGARDQPTSAVPRSSDEPWGPPSAGDRPHVVAALTAGGCPRHSRLLDAPPDPIRWANRRRPPGSCVKWIPDMDSPDRIHAAACATELADPACGVHRDLGERRPAPRGPPLTSDAHAVDRFVHDSGVPDRPGGRAKARGPSAPLTRRPGRRPCSASPAAVMAAPPSRLPTGGQRRGGTRSTRRHSSAPRRPERARWHPPFSRDRS